MCGIAGAIGTPDADIKVKKMLVALEHRGPDACGTYQAKNLSIGNTLLKITGNMAQPLAGKGILAVNGEIFNFKELAAESGIITDSDTEALFSLIETRINKGYIPINAVFSVLSSVNGDYALAYACDNELVLARDPVGVKPLFYSAKKRKGKLKIIFASEKKAFFTTGRDIKPLSPGSILSFNMKNGSFEERSLEIKPPHKRISVESEAVFRLKAVIEKALELRLTSTSGIAFSGGIDSTFLAVLAKRINPATPLYAVGLPDSHDITQAEKAAEAIGMKNSLRIHLLSVKEIENLIPQIIRATESVDPMKIAIGIPLYVVAKIARENGKRVILTGQGADELFGGYRRHEVFLEQGYEVLDREIYSDIKKISMVNLERDDMVTMANSIELRVPFLDKDVIKTGLAIIPDLKVLKKGSLYVRKYIFRKTAEDLLPSEIIWKEKKAIQYGTGVQKILNKLAREAGFSQRDGKYIGKYLRMIALEKGFEFIN
jgi:asparagine synthase (glutamine-hydrolysing)